MIRFLEMLLGITALCIGSTLGILAGLGQTTSTGTCSAISQATGLPVGTAMILLYSFFLLLQLLVLRRGFQLRRLLQVVPVWLQGLLLNYFRYDFGPFQTLELSSYGERLAALFVGTILISFGFSAVKSANFLNYPPEAFVVLLAERFGIRFGTCKIGLDAAYVLTSLVICALCAVKPDMVREGTILFMLCNGVLINFFQPRLERLFGASAQIRTEKAGRVA